MRATIALALLCAPAALVAQTQAAQPQAPAAAPAPAATQAAPPATQTADASGNPDEVICRREAETGSRLAARRVCRSRAQWEELQREMRNDIARAVASKPSSGQ